MKVRLRSRSEGVSGCDMLGMSVRSRKGYMVIPEAIGKVARAGEDKVVLFHCLCVISRATVGGVGFFVYVELVVLQHCNARIVT
jgi:hypothetical protein